MIRGSTQWSLEHRVSLKCGLFYVKTPTMRLKAALVAHWLFLSRTLMSASFHRSQTLHISTVSYPRRWTLRRRRPSGSRAAAAAGWSGRRGLCWFCSTNVQRSWDQSHQTNFYNYWRKVRPWCSSFQGQCLGMDRWLVKKQQNIFQTVSLHTTHFFPAWNTETNWTISRKKNCAV